MTSTPDRSQRPFSAYEASRLLARTPAVLIAWLRDLPEGWSRVNEGGETWSPFDVLGHLVHLERGDWMPRVRRILDQGETVPFDAVDRLAQFRESNGKTLEQLLDEFAQLRAESVRALRALAIDDAMLDRRGRHLVLGTVTLRQLLATWVAHDLDHMTQIARVMARQYADEVGPWRAYMRVISGTQG